MRKYITKALKIRPKAAPWAVPELWIVFDDNELSTMEMLFDYYPEELNQSEYLGLTKEEAIELFKEQRWKIT